LQGSNPRAAARAATWLAGAQSPSGGFGYRPGIAPDLDSTGLASWGLALEGRREAATRAAKFIRSAHASDGGFPALPGGDSNAQSTGLALIALRVAGLGPCFTTSSTASCSLDYIGNLSRPNGSIAYRPGSSPTPVWTTAQALLGLTARARLLDLEAPEGAG
jgi:prenyltransferase beta subunit